MTESAQDRIALSELMRVDREYGGYFWITKSDSHGDTDWLCLTIEQIDKLHAFAHQSQPYSSTSEERK